jgi:hypothetical protein
MDKRSGGSVNGISRARARHRAWFQGNASAAGLNKWAVEF